MYGTHLWKHPVYKNKNKYYELQELIIPLNFRNVKALTTKKACVSSLLNPYFNLFQNSNTQVRRKSLWRQKKKRKTKNKQKKLINNNSFQFFPRMMFTKHQGANVAYGTQF